MTKVSDLTDKNTELKSKIVRKFKISNIYFFEFLNSFSWQNQLENVDKQLKVQDTNLIAKNAVLEDKNTDLMSKVSSLNDKNKELKSKIVRIFLSHQIVISSHRFLLFLSWQSQLENVDNLLKVKTTNLTAEDAALDVKISDLANKVNGLEAKVSSNIFGYFGNRNSFDLCCFINRSKVI